MEYRKIVLETMGETGERVIKEKLIEMREIAEETSPIAVEDFTIIIGMAGQIGGQVIFGFKEDIVKIIASKMIEQEVTVMDELAISAVAEFTNVVCGNATIVLVDQGAKKIAISPPSIIMGKNMRVSTKIKPIQKYRFVYENVGEVIVHMALKEKEE